MRKAWKQKWFRMLIYALVVVVVIIIILPKGTIDGTKGGILEGASHRNGGIKGRLRSTGETIEMEGNENILTSNVNRIKGAYICQGTLGGISSAVNEEAGGVEFDRNGSCVIKN